jgi:mercuric ion binding protein
MRTLLAALLTAALMAAPAVAAELKTVALDVTKMDCAVCPLTVRKALEKVPGVKSAKVDYASRSAVVAFDPDKTSAETFTKATADAGYPSSVRQVQ